MRSNRKNEILRLEKVWKSFGGLVVLSDIDLSIEREEIVGLIGPNGAGKSTLFNVITAFYKPDQGSIFLENRNITGIAPYKICHLGVARTFQLVKAFLKMTVFENVMVSSIYSRRIKGKELKKRTLEALDLVGLSDKKNMLIAHITLSDRRLLEIAMALVSMPVLTLLDEPMAGLTPAEIVELQKVIKRANKEKKVTFLWIEHKVDAIMDFCDRVVVLDYGLKIADGAPNEILRNQKVIEAYLGESSA